MDIRIATIDDLQGIQQIYNDSIKEGVSTLDVQAKSVYEWRLWFQESKDKGYTTYVAEDGGKIVGYANFSAFRKKDGFAETVEIDVYVSAAHRNKGVGTALAEALLKAGKESNRVHIVISVINADNEISRKMEEKFEFTHAGTLPDVAKKFGEYRGIEYYYKILG